MNAYDIIVVGSGPGGYTLALECARKGLKTALVEEHDTPGGTCLNVGCIPSKALLESSEFYYRIQNEADSHGINVSEFSLNLTAMMARKNAVVAKLTSGIAALLKNRDVDRITGRGEILRAGTVRVTSSTHAPMELKASKIVLATGSKPIELPNIPFDGKKIVDSTAALSFTSVPKSLAVVGAGAVGLEIGSIWSRLGSHVTIIEALDRIVPGSDPHASRILAGALRKQGIDIKTGNTLSTAEVGARKVKLTLVNKDSEKEETFLSVDKVLVAVGRRANIDSGCAQGVELKRTLDGRCIHVDHMYQTSLPGVFAIGDLVGNPMLAHKATEDAAALAAILTDASPLPWSGPVPGIVYTEPEMAWVGESEDSLKTAGIAFEKGQFSFAANGRALASGREEGFVKLLSTPNDGRLLGAVIVGCGASELINEVVSVMAMGGAAEDIALTVHGHPTLSEAIKEAALDLLGRPLHRA